MTCRRTAWKSTRHLAHCQTPHGDISRSESHASPTARLIFGPASAMPKYVATRQTLQADVDRASGETTDLYGAPDGGRRGDRGLRKDAVLNGGATTNQGRMPYESARSAPTPQCDVRRLERCKRRTRANQIEAGNDAPVPRTKSHPLVCSSRWSTSPTRSISTLPAIPSPNSNAELVVGTRLVSLRCRDLTYVGAASGTVGHAPTAIVELSRIA